MAKVTPIPEELGEDLNEIKVLIDERTAAISENEVQYNAINKENDMHRQEIKFLQDAIMILLNLKKKDDDPKVVKTESEKEMASAMVVKSEEGIK